MMRDCQGSGQCLSFKIRRIDRRSRSMEGLLQSMRIDMGEYYHRVAALREDRAAAVAALDNIETGASIIQDGANVAEQRRRYYQNVLAKIDALVTAYEDIDGPRGLKA